jgi:large subunit ribosomal protein L34e
MLLHIFVLKRFLGGKLVLQYITKKANGPSCGDCGAKIQGVPALRPKEYARIPRSEKSVTRAYGGSRCAHCVRDRIVRAFLIEEQKIVKRVIKAQSQQKKKAEKEASKKK